MRVKIICIIALTKCRIIKDRIPYFLTLCMIRIEKIMGKYKGIVKTIIDFLVFWAVFKWKDGFIAVFVSEKIKTIHTHIKLLFLSCENDLAQLWGAFVEFSPFGQDIAQNPEFRYCLIIGTVCVVLAFVFFLYGLKDAWNWFWSIMISPIAAISMWYIFFQLCCLTNIYKIPLWFHAIAFVASVGLGFISFIIVLAVLLIFIT